MAKNNLSLSRSFYIKRVKKNDIDRYIENKKIESNRRKKNLGPEQTHKHKTNEKKDIMKSSYRNHNHWESVEWEKKVVYFKQH